MFIEMSKMKFLFFYFICLWGFEEDRNNWYQTVSVR